MCNCCWWNADESIKRDVDEDFFFFFDFSSKIFRAANNVTWTLNEIVGSVKELNGIWVRRRREGRNWMVRLTKFLIQVRNSNWSLLIQSSFTPLTPAFYSLFLLLHSFIPAAAPSMLRRGKSYIKSFDPAQISIAASWSAKLFVVKVSLLFPSSSIIHLFSLKQHPLIYLILDTWIEEKG